MKRVIRVLIFSLCCDEACRYIKTTKCSLKILDTLVMRRMVGFGAVCFI